jgi:ElaB/YqjD/DUF883 family membrane-anchored ribosome-binding protein
MNTNVHTTATNARRAVEAAPQAIADAVQEGSERITPALVQAAERAESLVRQSADALRDHATNLRERAADASDRTASYIRDEPLKSVLIAAAAGAALMAVANLALRSRQPH